MQHYNMAGYGEQMVQMLSFNQCRMQNEETIAATSNLQFDRGFRVFKFWMIVGAVFGLDQGTKLVVQRLMEPGLSVEVIGQILCFTYALNPGGAFGILGDYQAVLLGISLLVVAVVLVAVPRIVRAGYIWPVGFLLGGALGNLADRLRFGKVVDFIDFGFWPIFNIADIAIVTGTALLGSIILRQQRDHRGDQGGHV
jgi:signal peptidase II